MKLTTKGRYAVTAMLDLSLYSGKGPVTLAEISSRQGISISYLEQLFAMLRKNELVNSVRGPGGGYLLSRDNGEIDIASIIDAVNEAVDVTRCRGGEGCQDGERCLTHYLWEDLSSQLRNFLSGITLKQLFDQREVREVAARQELQSSTEDNSLKALNVN